MNTAERRYDIDWLRVIAIFLLIFYHVLIAFVPGVPEAIFMIPSEERSIYFFIPGLLLNIWRIPLLFFISGMGVAFAMHRRNIKELIKERSMRILLPYVFGALTLGPLILYIGMLYLRIPYGYIPVSMHLWFLLNIWLYAVVFSPLLYAFKHGKLDWVINPARQLVRNPLGLYLFALPYIAYGATVQDFSSYAQTLHGYIIGAISFLMGFFIIQMGSNLWETTKKYKWMYLAIAFGLYAVRFGIYGFENIPPVLVAIESISWIYTAFGLGYSYLNTESKKLRYLSTAVYPVYILHFLLQYLFSFFVMPLQLPLLVEFFIIFIGTVGGSFVIYEFILKRSGMFKVLFGMH